MRPNSATFNIINTRQINFILFSQNCRHNTFNQSNFDCFNLLVGKFLIILSALSNHIYRIISLCTQEKVFGINTSTIVAAMQSIKALWNRIMCQNPCNSVSSYYLTFTMKESIPSVTFSRFPIPTFIRTRLLNLIPKSTYIRAMILALFRKPDNRFAMLTNDGLSDSRHKVLIT